MIDALRQFRLSRLQLALVASLSALATALVIATALGHTAAQRAAIAALTRRPEIIRVASAGRPAAAAPAPAVATAADPAPVSPASSSPAGPVASADSGSTRPAASTPSDAPGDSVLTTTTTATRTPAPQRRKVRHVFVIALSTPSYEAAFGSASVAHYLNRTLRPRGTLLGGYESLGGTELPDYLAMVSGQGPNPDTRLQCSTYAEFPPHTKPASNGQIPGTGCVYPNTIITIGDQVAAAGQVWKAFIGDMQPSTCVHPNSGALDGTQLPGAGAQYASRHNPFIYFHSLLDLGGCASNDVSLAKLQHALRSSATTPSYAFIAPRACEDASSSTCPDGKPAGLAGQDEFLRTWVPRIRRSEAYRRDGVLVLAFAPTAAASSSGGPVPTGALVLSPFAAPGKTISTAYDPYSLLRSAEELLGYKLLARAAAAKSFADSALPRR